VIAACIQAVGENCENHGDLLMPAKLKAALLILGLFACAGCAALVAGAGAGVYTYVSGELKRTYNAPFDKAVNESLSALQDLKIKVIKQRSSGITTTIEAEKSDSSPVTVTLTIIGTNMTEITVRTGVVGYWDKKVSELIHAQIAKRLL
jgi:hypothetical protein